MGGPNVAEEKLITEAERVAVAKTMYADSEHAFIAMRANFTFNYCAQALGRKMEPARLQLNHMHLIANTDDDVLDDCRVLGLQSYGTDKAARAARQKGVARHRNPYLCSFAAAAYQLAWTNDVRGKEVISYVRHAADKDRRTGWTDDAGVRRLVPLWGLRRLVFGNDPEETASESVFHKDWDRYPTSDKVSKCPVCLYICAVLVHQRSLTII